MLSYKHVSHNLSLLEDDKKRHKRRTKNFFEEFMFLKERIVKGVEGKNGKKGLLDTNAQGNKNKEDQYDLIGARGCDTDAYIEKW